MLGKICGPSEGSQLPLPCHPRGESLPSQWLLTGVTLSLRHLARSRAGPGPGRHKKNQEGKCKRSSRASLSCPLSHPSLETLWVFTRRGGVAPGHLYWVEPGDAAQHPETLRWPPRRGMMWPRMSAVPSGGPRPGPGYLIKKGEPQLIPEL